MNKSVIRQPKFDVVYDHFKGEIINVREVTDEAAIRPSRTTWLHANLQLTSGCNLACRYCRTNSSPKVDTSGELITDEWIRLFDELKDDGVKSVFATGGEIFNRSDIWESLTALNKRFLTHVLCNGQVLTEELTASQKEILRNLASVQISIDNASPEVNDRFRGKGTWQKAVEAVKLLNRLGVEVIVSSVVFPNRAKDAKPLAALTQSLGAKLLLRPLLPQGRGKRMDCPAIDVRDIYAEIGLLPYARGFLAYSEELYRFGVNESNIVDCGVLAFAPDGRRRNIIDG